MVPCRVYWGHYVWFLGIWLIRSPSGHLLEDEWPPILVGRRGVEGNVGGSFVRGFPEDLEKWMEYERAGGGDPL
ncbi:hypothetical protein BJY52DRAFT_803767 [Lactarius psammicola]|nr:hypothetical protein BJY52DRAFT_803767 [Lactarius psammicola]